MTPPLIAALYGGLNALILLWLATEVITRRRSGRISHGDGGDGSFAKIIRGHANAAETIPMAIILLTLAELIGAPAIDRTFGTIDFLTLFDMSRVSSRLLLSVLR